MKKNNQLLLLSVCLLLLATGCNKKCHCYGYDGSHTYYSKEEVNDAGKSCSEMIYFANFRRYSICEWD